MKQVLRVQGALVGLLALAHIGWAYTKSRSEHEWCLKQLKAQLKQSPRDHRVLTEIGERLTLWMADHEDEREEVPLAEFYLKKAMSVHPKDPLPVAWLGVITMVQARSASLFDRKGLAKKGLAILDRAVDLDPEQLKVRLLRGSVCVKVPGAFKRHEQALKDLSKVARAVEANPRLADEQNISWSVLYLNLGKAYRHLGDLAKARVAWEMATRYEPDRDENREAAQLLERHLGRNSGGWDRFLRWSYSR